MGEPRFSIGQLVKHKRHNYRGVVYEVHPEGNPDDNWGQKTENYETGEVAWYRILVHDASHASFLSEMDILEDEGGEEVLNPRVKQVFENFSQGRYKPRII